jgi:hypothetical protein
MLKRTNALPSHDAWNLDADLAFLKRYRKLVACAPASALTRMAPYMGQAVNEALRASQAPHSANGADVEAPL